MDPDVLNASQAATLLGAHVETIRRLARRGEIPCFKVGKDWRFHRALLERWSQTHRPPRSATVLIVDDEPATRRVMSRVVERLGHRALVAGDARAGLELVEREAPALVLLDLRMPELSGPQFLKLLRATHPSLPVVIVTGYPDGELMQEAAQYAPLMLLAKPFLPEQLERTMGMVLGEDRASMAR